MNELFIEIKLKQNTKEWEDWRNQGVGASDAPSIMGENQFKSRSSLLLEKKNNLRPIKNQKMIQGTQLEPIARKLYIERIGIDFSPICIQSKEYSWLRASLDGISNDMNQVVEIKCGISAYEKARRGIVPRYYYGQLQHQLLITGLNEISYWCYIPRLPGICLRIKRNDSYINKLFSEEEKFARELMLV